MYGVTLGINCRLELLQVKEFVGNVHENMKRTALSQKSPVTGFSEHGYVASGSIKSYKMVKKDPAQLDSIVTGPMNDNNIFCCFFPKFLNTAILELRLNLAK